MKYLGSIILVVLVLVGTYQFVFADEVTVPVDENDVYQIVEEEVTSSTITTLTVTNCTGCGDITGSGTSTFIVVWDGTSSTTGYAELLYNSSTNIFQVTIASTSEAIIQSSTIGTSTIFGDFTPQTDVLFNFGSLTERLLSLFTINIDAGASSTEWKSAVADTGTTSTTPFRVFWDINTNTPDITEYLRAWKIVTSNASGTEDEGVMFLPAYHPGGGTSNPAFLVTRLKTAISGGQPARLGFVDYEDIDSFTGMRAGGSTLNFDNQGDQSVLATITAGGGGLLVKQVLQGGVKLTLRSQATYTANTVFFDMEPRFSGTATSTNKLFEAHDDDQSTDLFNLWFGVTGGGAGMPQANKLSFDDVNNIRGDTYFIYETSTAFQFFFDGVKTLDVTSTLFGIISDTNVTGTFSVSASSTYPSYVSCTALETDANGLLICGSDATGAGGGVATTSVAVDELAIFADQDTLTSFSNLSFNSSTGELTINATTTINNLLLTTDLAETEGGTGVSALDDIVGTASEITVSAGANTIIGGDVTISLPSIIDLGASSEFSVTSSTITGSSTWSAYTSCTALETDANGLLVCGTDDGISGYEIASSTSALDSDSKTHSVACSGSKNVMGGGVSVSGTVDNDLAIQFSHPSGTGAWEARGVETDAVADNWEITVYAICSD